MTLKTAKTAARLTPKQVTAITGPLDDAAVAEIIATGARPQELTEAYVWLTEEGDLGAELRRFPSGVVGRLCEILDRTGIRWEEER